MSFTYLYLPIQVVLQLFFKFLFDSSTGENGSKPKPKDRHETHRDLSFTLFARSAILPSRVVPIAQLPVPSLYDRLWSACNTWRGGYSR